jgi:TM2 domain-containing membrane protein YozV
MSDKKPTLEDLGLDAPAPPPTAKKSWQQIADQIDDQPYRPTPAAAPEPAKSWNGIAAVLSFLIPGLGQLYKGHVVSGLVLFVVTLLCYGLFLLLGIVPHIIAIIDAGTREK